MSKGNVLYTDDALVTGAICILASATGIDFKTSSSTTSMYTVPAGKKLHITEVRVYPTSVDTVTGVPIISFGKSGVWSEYKSNVTITNVDQIGEDWVMSTANSKGYVFDAGDVVGLKIEVGATATTYVGNCDLIGYLTAA
jgi:hypothetical protein